MKRVMIFALLFYCVSQVHSQDCLDKVASQAVIIDSLQKVIKEKNASYLKLTTDNQITIKALKDSVTILKDNLSNLEKYRALKKTFDAQLNQKSDSIALLKADLKKKEGQISNEKLKCEKAVSDARNEGKTEAAANLINYSTFAS